MRDRHTLLAVTRRSGLGRYRVGLERWGNTECLDLPEELSGTEFRALARPGRSGFRRKELRISIAAPRSRPRCRSDSGRDQRER